MWINQLSVYTLEFANPEEWGELFSKHPVDSPAIGATKHLGFASFYEGTTFVDNIDRHHAFQPTLAERKVPRDAIEREVKRRHKNLDANDESAQKAAWLEVATDLNDKAAVREKPTTAVYDDYSKQLFVFGSPSQAENVVITAMRAALGSLHAVPMVLKEAPEAKLTKWLTEGAAPAPFLLGRFAELDSSESEGGKTTFKGQDLGGPVIKQHLEQGDRVTQLQLNWNGQLEFILNARGEIKKIGPPDCEFKPQHAFNIWPDIMDRLPQFYEDVLKLLGGASDQNKPLEVKERAQDEEEAGTPSSEDSAGAATAPSAPASKAQPATEGVRIGVVAEGQKGDVEAFRDAMDNLHQRRPLAELLIPSIPNDLMRGAYAWANEKGIKVTLIKHEDPEVRRNDLVARAPKGIVVFGDGEETQAIHRLATASQIAVMRLTRPN